MYVVMYLASHSSFSYFLSKLHERLKRAVTCFRSPNYLLTPKKHAMINIGKKCVRSLSTVGTYFQELHNRNGIEEMETSEILLAFHICANVF